MNLTKIICFQIIIYLKKNYLKKDNFLFSKVIICRFSVTAIQFFIYITTLNTSLKLF